MNTLSLSDTEILDRLDLPADQRAVIEDYWRENPPAPKKKVVKISGSTFLWYSILTVMVFACFSPPRPLELLADLAVGLIWSLMIVIGPLLIVASFFVTRKIAARHPERLLGREHISSFTKSGWTVKKVVAHSYNVVLAIATAVAGYTVTAVSIVIAMLVLQGVIMAMKDMLAKNLTVLADRRLEGLKQAKVVYQ